jgi:hypothetical protein
VDLGGGRIYGLAIGLVGARAGARGGLLRCLPDGLLLNLPAQPVGLRGLLIQFPKVG